MTPFKLPDKQQGFADLRALLQANVCNAVVPTSEIGALPNEKIKQIKRLTLHLDSFKQHDERRAGQIDYMHSGK